MLTEGAIYHEVAPQLVLMGYLHRIINGGGQVCREYGIGRGRIDLLIHWPYRDATGRQHSQREAIELKVERVDQAVAVTVRSHQVGYSASITW